MQLMSTPEAGAYLGVSPHTLRAWRAADAGPRWIKLGGRVVYRRESLDAFVSEQEHLTVTHRAGA